MVCLGKQKSNKEPHVRVIIFCNLILPVLFEILSLCSKRLINYLFLVTFQLELGASLVGSVGKEAACNAGDQGSIPGSQRSPGGGNGNPL